MARKSRTINAATTKWVEALRRLDRVTNVARASVRMARAASNLTLSRGHRWQVPAQVAALKDKQTFETGFILTRRTASGGSGTGSSGELGGSEADNRSKDARGGSGWHRATAIVRAGARVSRVSELSRAMDALSRVERSVELGNDRGASSGARNYPTKLASDTGATNRAGADHETRRLTFGDTGILANVRVVPPSRGVTPPRGVSQREFAQPSSGVGAPNGGGGRSAITINSSPTVVINAAAGSAVQHDVIGALRAHREELFDQLKRESARRERSQF
jgi:hypothetical protein